MATSEDHPSLVPSVGEPEKRELHTGMFVIDGKEISGDSPALPKKTGREVSVRCSCGEWSGEFNAPTGTFEDMVPMAKGELALHQHEVWGVASGLHETA